MPAEDDFRASLLAFKQQRPVSSGTAGGSSVPLLSLAGQSWQSVSGSFQTTLDRARQSVGPQQTNGSTSEEWFKLTAFQRTVGFLMCTFAAGLCFVLAMFTLPTVLIVPQKFVMTYTMSSIFSILAFAVMRGPKAFAKHLVSPERRLFTSAYFGSMFLTIFAVVYVKSYIFIVLCSMLQFVAIVWYYVSYLPGGHGAMSWMTKAFLRTSSGISI